MRDVDALALAIVGDGGRKRTVRDCMQRMRRNRQQSPRKLVHTLRAAFEERDAALDAEFDRLVVACFEMQPGYIFARAPVASPQRRRVVYVQRRAQPPAGAVTLYQQHVLAERRGDLVEEVERQVRRRMMRVVRSLVALEEEGAVGRRDVGARLANEGHARFVQPPPLLLDLLALVMVERGEE